MKFFDECDREKFIALYGEELLKDDNLFRNFLRNRSDYVKNILGFKRAMTQKQNWRKYRFIYQMGINRYYRSVFGQDTRNRIVTALKGGLELSGVFSLKGEDAYSFVADVVLLESECIKTLSYFMLEEAYADQILFVESVVEASREISEKVISEQPVSETSLEVLINLVYKELFGESLPQDELGSEDLLTLFHSIRRPE